MSSMKQEKNNFIQIRTTNYDQTDRFYFNFITFINFTVLIIRSNFNKMIYQYSIFRNVYQIDSLNQTRIFVCWQRTR